MPAELTVTHAQDRLGDADVFGLDCPQHPENNRYNLTQRHAMNAVAKHNRDHHGEPVFDLTAAAQAFLDTLEYNPSAGTGAFSVWAALTGTSTSNTEGHEMIHALAVEYAGAEPPILLSAPPF